MRLSMLIALVRPMGPVIVGISLGFTLSLLSVTWVDEPCDGGGGGALGATEGMLMMAQAGSLKGARKPNSISTGTAEHGDAGGEDFEPRIVPYNKPAQQGPPKKVFRAKYASTELGIRERLFVAVMTSKNTMNTLAVAANRTLNHHLEGRLIFFTGTRNRKIPHGMFVVAHGDERPVLNMFQTVHYLLEHHITEYDWFYLVQDDTYTQPDRLKTLVDHLSMDHQLYMGRPGEFIGGEAQGRYCHGESGFLLSRALLLKLRPFLEQCRMDIVSVRPDEWLGRCIIDYAGISCVEEHEGLHYNYFEMEKNVDLNGKESLDFQNALSVHPVSSSEQMYQLHRYFTERELQKTYEEIKKLQAEIKNISHVAVDGNRSAVWPVGIPPPFQPKSRFEVLRWDYFTEEQLFSCADDSPKCQLNGADREDVADVIQVAVAELNKKYSPVLQLSAPRLVNGYRRFDPTRGMEYTLDLQLQAMTESGYGQAIEHRVHLVRPLSQVEIIPMPYVTEATRVHVVLPLTSPNRPVALHFLDLCASNLFEQGENAVLTFLFLYEPAEAQKVGTTDVFAEVKAKVAAVERRYPNVKIPWISVKTENPGFLRVLDIVSRKHPVDTLFLLATADTVLNSEFLNRCRMNAISGWQVFFPVHFQDFDPHVAFPNGPPQATPDLVREAGHFDRYAFEEACFYNADYMAARTQMTADTQENEELLENLDVYDVFVQYSGLHVFRAVEPALRQAYRNRTCDPQLSEEMFHRCLQSINEGIGSRSQLAMLMFEQEQGNST
ncbi:LOW QUALITY PROTEIN: chondroitin sulfate synthase 2 [Colossoma macropomum]|uniref:LOW QUALITY PROTEIN: chondroitin sulfate synthase 2 n=1 Tax=Colossoma macropomum TaxID=42526 RepID=UPI001865386F|nr:LOW QUALITY PROTEIN: chondroitin sulfate synthase 2 [Colossoma macropomum]